MKLFNNILMILQGVVENVMKMTPYSALITLTNINICRESTALVNYMTIRQFELFKYYLNSLNYIILFLKKMTGNVINTL